MSEKPPHRPFDLFSETSRLPVNPAIINERLNQLWESSAPTDDSDANYTRLSLANLVVITDRQTQQEAELLILQFAQERPSRTILITLDSDNDPTKVEAMSQEGNAALVADVAIACSLGGGERGMLCWERIGIETPLESISQVPSAIRALAGGMNQLVLVDLTEEDFPEQVGRELSQLADYHFFDSSANRRKLAQYLKRSPEKLSGVFDLAYERSHPLREAIKFAFDDPRLQERIEQISGISVSLTSKSSKQQHRVFAYLSGWFVSKLQLTPTGEVLRRSIRYRNPSGNELTISPLDSSTEGQELQVRFCFDDSALQTVTISSRGFLSEKKHSSPEFLFEILYNDEPFAEYNAPSLTNAGYILRRLSDVRRRSDYTDTLAHTKALLSKQLISTSKDDAA